MTKDPRKIRLDQLKEMAVNETQKYEPHFRNCAANAFTEGFLYAVQMLIKSEEQA